MKHFHQNFIIVATASNLANQEFVAIYEHRKLPWIGVQFHPEKTVFEHSDGLHLNKSEHSFNITNKMAQFFFQLLNGTISKSLTSKKNKISKHKKQNSEEPENLINSTFHQKFAHLKAVSSPLDSESIQIMRQTVQIRFDRPFVDELLEWDYLSYNQFLDDQIKKYQNAKKKFKNENHESSETVIDQETGQKIKKQKTFKKIVFLEKSRWVSLTENDHLASLKAEKQNDFQNPLGYLVKVEDNGIPKSPNESDQ